MPRHYSRAIGRLSPLAFHVRGEPKSRSCVPRLPRFVVRWRGPRAAAGILGFGRRSGHGAFAGSYLPKTNAPCE